MKCVLNSTDPEHFNEIHANIPPLSGCKYCSVSCSSFATNCNIETFSNDDLVKFLLIKEDGTTEDLEFRFYEGTASNAQVVAEHMTEYFTKNLKPKHPNIDFAVYENPRKFDFRFYCRHEDNYKDFWLCECSYNLRLLLGIYSYDDISINNPIKYDQYEKYTISGVYHIHSPAIGMYLSTPVLYLVSNIGAPTMRNATNSTKMEGCNVLMTIYNSFSPNIPIIASGDGTSNIIAASEITGATFELVDANMQPVKLLNPMYITIELTPIDSIYDK